MGHAFEYVKIDSSHLLMPQRRERVWGSSSTGDEPSTYAMYMKWPCNGWNLANGLGFPISWTMPFPAVIHQQVPTLPPIWTQSENFARNGICVNQRWHWTQARPAAVVRSGPTICSHVFGQPTRFGYVEKTASHLLKKLFAPMGCLLRISKTPSRCWIWTLHWLLIWLEMLFPQVVWLQRSYAPWSMQPHGSS